MAKRPWLTSDELIEAVKNSIAFPLAQVTFTEENILDFASQELFNSQVPSIMEYHEEYFVHESEIQFKDNVSKYPIPSRAVGMKLRDLFYVDSNTNLIEMSNIGLGNADVYQSGNDFSWTNPGRFYIQGDDIVVVPKVGKAPTNSHLLAKYYLRPNSLVKNERAAICTSFIKEITVTNASVVAGDTISFNGTTLTADTDFVIGASSTATATNIATAINSLEIDGITATSTSNIVYFLYELQSTVLSTSNNGGLTLNSRVGIQCSSIPDHFIDGMLIDFLQTAGGHKTYAYDVKVPKTGISSNAVFVPSSDLPAGFIVGDYICEQYECIIPQIPSDLHNLLVERTGARILKALGDNEGANAQLAVIQTLESRQSTMVRDRTEGAPQKVFNKNGLLRSAKRFRKRF